jgi:transcriptional/translational regulatory protein YebC/TACO1
VRAAFNKCDGTFGTSGSVIFMFDHTCNFRVKREDLSMDLEDFELELIDFEVEEIFEDEDGIMIYAPFGQFGAIQSYLEENKLEILQSGFEYIPTTTKKVDEAQQADIDKLLEKLEEDDDVQNVYHSMEA